MGTKFTRAIAQPGPSRPPAEPREFPSNHNDVVAIQIEATTDFFSSTANSESSIGHGPTQ